MVLNKGNKESILKAYRYYMPCGVSIAVFDSYVELKHGRTVISTPLRMITLKRFISSYEVIQYSIFNMECIEPSMIKEIDNYKTYIENDLIIEEC